MKFKSWKKVKISSYYMCKPQSINTFSEAKLWKHEDSRRRKPGWKRSKKIPPRQEFNVGSLSFHSKPWTKSNYLYECSRYQTYSWFLWSQISRHQSEATKPNYEHFKAIPSKKFCHVSNSSFHSSEHVSIWICINCQRWHRPADDWESLWVLAFNLFLSVSWVYKAL